MRNKEHGQILFLLQLHQQVDNLRLDGNVQCGNRLVAEQKFRVDRQCAGNTDSLALSAGKFMDVSHRMFRIKSYHIQQLEHHPLFLRLCLCQLVDADALRYNVVHLLVRVQRSVWVLENHLHLAAEIETFLPAHPVNVLALIQHFAAGAVQHPDAGFAAGGLSTARFSDNAQCFTLVNDKGNIVHRLEHTLFTCFIIFTEVLYLQFDRSIVHPAHLRYGMERR